MVEVTQADRKAAWHFRPSCYGLTNLYGWVAGQYDKAPFAKEWDYANCRSSWLHVPGKADIIAYRPAP